MHYRDPRLQPAPCITNVFATRRKNFSQWHRSFQRKLLSHWLKFLRHVAITLVIQGPAASDAGFYQTQSRASGEDTVGSLSLSMFQYFRSVLFNWNSSYKSRNYENLRWWINGLCGMKDRFEAPSLCSEWVTCTQMLFSLCLNYANLQFRYY